MAGYLLLAIVLLPGAAHIGALVWSIEWIGDGPGRVILATLAALEWLGGSAWAFKQASRYPSRWWQASSLLALVTVGGLGVLYFLGGQEPKGEVRTAAAIAYPILAVVYDFLLLAGQGDAVAQAQAQTERVKQDTEHKAEDSEAQERQEAQEQEERDRKAAQDLELAKYKLQLQSEERKERARLKAEQARTEQTNGTQARTEQTIGTKARTGQTNGTERANETRNGTGQDIDQRLLLVYQDRPQASLRDVALAVGLQPTQKGQVARAVNRLVADGVLTALPNGGYSPNGHTPSLEVAA